MPVSETFAYFDHAAVAPLPSPTAAAIRQYAEQASAGGDVDWLSWAKKLEELRKLLAQCMGAEAGEIALLPNTTAGINLVAEGLPWQPGENVVVPANEFPSNLLPYRNLARRGVETRTVPAESDGSINLEALNQAIDQKTRLLAISWVGFASGYRIDLDAIAELAERRGCLLLVDAIQGMGVFPLDISSTAIDFVCADGHKWLLGPEGAGFCYIRRERLEQLTPLGVGWNSLNLGSFDPESTDLKATAARYEGGTMNMPGFHGFLESARLLAGLNGPHESVADAVLANVADLAERLRQKDFEALIADDVQHQSGIVGIRWPGATDRDYQAARKHLLDQKVVTSVRGERLRVSTHAYNNDDDRERLVQGLLEFRRST